MLIAKCEWPPCLCKLHLGGCAYVIPAELNPAAQVCFLLQQGAECICCPLSFWKITLPPLPSPPPIAPFHAPYISPPLKTLFHSACIPLNLSPRPHMPPLVPAPFLQPPPPLPPPALHPHVLSHPITPPPHHHSSPHHISKHKQSGLQTIIVLRIPLVIIATIVGWL